ncbi:cytochrome P450 [Actinomadura citrea]|uniref:Cytochrome P450 n=2 Tax=Actinomadura citrea TaxID=46158 RepID=A0A7Y9KG50_9ACTN|nr:cytochrome P450 [Actinomadura citrea]GGT96060.1 hypothetical protein GCM10010177_64090 [Actinomadura citrea]
MTRPPPAQHMTFGYGAHFCLGARLARLEVTTVLSVLLAEFPALELAVPASQVDWRKNALVTGPKGLPVRW